jgi:hypothetical protein
MEMSTKYTPFNLREMSLWTALDKVLTAKEAELANVGSDVFRIATMKSTNV